MKEDYLWNKTGSDPEIEKLENALKAFCYQEVAPPALPAKIIPFEKKTSRGFFRLTFAFAAFAALVIVFFGVWFQVLSGDIKSVSDLSETITPPINVEATVSSTFAESNQTSNEKVEMPPQKSNAVVPTAVSDASRFRVKSNAVVPTAVSDASRFRVKNLSASGVVSAGRNAFGDSSRDDCVTSAFCQYKSVKNNETAKNIEVKKPTVKLTKQEKYAYDQLMLALSITSSKLKLVTDKIENIEEENAVR